MKLYNSIEDIKKTALAMIAQADALERLVSMDIPGRFVFSPPDSSRLIVSSLDELHEARMALKKLFNWQDCIENKFYSCGLVIATYRPNNDIKLPLPFQLWVESPPKTFPKKILGNCKLVKLDSEDYTIVCEV